jgi:uncharacterized protein YaeQ
MAKTATIFKVTLNISDMDRDYYAEHLLTVARHPSETNERMMMRLLVFILHADEQLLFTKGLSTDNEPDLWQISLTNEIDLWIDVGLPDERRIRKACHRAKQVYIYTYGGRGANLWWQKNASKLERFTNLTVIEVPEAATKALADLTERNMQLQCTVQEGNIWLNSGDQNYHVSPIYKYSNL